MQLGEEDAASEIASIAAHAAFGRPLITNVHRGLIAEAIVSKALGPRWRWCSADYAAWDFERADGWRLEVKQAASRQTWHRAEDRSSRISFDIRERKGRYDGARWLARAARWANLYVFAHHYVIDDPDHRDPAQWLFYVVAEERLPAQRTIGLSGIQSLASAAPVSRLNEEVELASASIRSR